MLQSYDVPQGGMMCPFSPSPVFTQSEAHQSCAGSGLRTAQEVEPLKHLKEEMPLKKVTVNYVTAPKDYLPHIGKCPLATTRSAQGPPR